MRLIVALTGFLVFSFSLPLNAQSAFPVSFSIRLDDDLNDVFEDNGRLFVFISESERGEPRFQLWPISKRRNYIYARTMVWDGETPLNLNGSDDFMSTADFSFNAVPEGTYTVQVLWDQDTLESRIHGVGNLYSEPLRVEIDKEHHIDLEIDRQIAERTLIEHELVRMVDFQSDTLSAWWGRPFNIKAAVVLPSGYHEDEAAKYPVRYNVAGFGGRFTRVNRLLEEGRKFEEWWSSNDAPQILQVFLDGEGPFGDCYQLDSENSGPYGYALIHELIPYVESKYRGAGKADLRFVDGCSTGGWVSLALQIFYPDHFNGTFSYSPDAVDFEHYQTVNIYQDENAFVNEWGHERPVMRDINGDPRITMRQFIHSENVQGYNDTYLTAGGQFGAHSALYSPRGQDGLPIPLFDPQSGDIDPAVAEHWKKYDLKMHLEDNWSELGPKLQGKIWIWMGDMDQFLLNPATRTLDTFLKNTTNPTSDATILFDAMTGHCTNFSHQDVLEMIEAKVNSN